MDFSARLAGLKILARFENTGLGFSARAKLPPGLNPSPCNRQFGFQRICYRSRAEISARDEIRHVIRPLPSCGLVSHSLRSWPIFRLTNTGWIVVCSLMLRSFNCILYNNISGVLVLEGYDYSSHIISRQSSRGLQWLLVSNSRVDKAINGGVDKAVRVVQP